MTLGFTFYKGVTGLLDPMVPLVLRRRVASGKEDGDRTQERRGYASRPRPPGPLVWMHGASIGESQVLLLLFEALKKERPDLSALITTQTRTSADLIARRSLPDLIHQVAPFDTPFSCKRFLNHWKPDLAVFAEGDIWPNLISHLDKRRIPRLLINARMTEKSFDGWMRFPALAKRLFGGFDQILAANTRTYDGLRQFAGRSVKLVGNLKYAAPPLHADMDEVLKLKAVVGERPVLAALSTHPGEDEKLISAWKTLKTEIPDLLLILAPRHPERGSDILTLCEEAKTYHRSEGGTPDPADQIWVCDTLGELGLWMRLSSLVFLGGGLPGSEVHGHNPIEPLKLDRLVLSFPDVSNFRQEFDDMVASGAAILVSDEDQLIAEAKPYLNGTKIYNPPEKAERLRTYLSGEEPLTRTRDAVLSRLKTGAPE